MRKAQARSSFDELRRQIDSISQALEGLRGALESGAPVAIGISEIERSLDHSYDSRCAISTSLMDEAPAVPKGELQRMAVALARMARHIGVAAHAMAATDTVACREAFVQASVLLAGALRLLDEAVEDLQRKGVESKSTRDLPRRIRPLIEATHIAAHDITVALTLKSMEGAANHLCLRLAADRLSAAGRGCGHAAELIAILVSDLSLHSASQQTVTF